MGRPRANPGNLYLAAVATDQPRLVGTRRRGGSGPPRAVLAAYLPAGADGADELPDWMRASSCWLSWLAISLPPLALPPIAIWWCIGWAADIDFLCLGAAAEVALADALGVGVLTAGAAGAAVAAGAFAAGAAGVELVWAQPGAAI